MCWEATAILALIFGSAMYGLVRLVSVPPFTASGFLLWSSFGFLVLFWGIGLKIILTEGVSAIKADPLMPLAVVAPFFFAAVVAAGWEQWRPYRWQYPQWQIQAEAERENYERDELAKLSARYAPTPEPTP